MHPRRPRPSVRPPFGRWSVRFPVSRRNVNLLSSLPSLCCLSSVAFCGGGRGEGGGGLIEPHVHVLGLIHPEICRIGEQRKVPKPPYMHHKGKWENGGKRERGGDQRGRWDQVSKNEMQFFSSSSLPPLFCMCNFCPAPDYGSVAYMRI